MAYRSDKEEIKLSLFTDDMTDYRQDPKSHQKLLPQNKQKTTQTLLVLTSEFSKVARQKINKQKINCLSIYYQ